MKDKNYELELYKLITDEEDGFINEFGWVSNTEFLVWIYYFHLDGFIEKAIKIFGDGMFDDSGFDANIQADGVCIDLCKMLDGYLDLEAVFPKEKYQH